MQITLRRAAQLQNELQREIAATNLETVGTFKLNAAVQPVEQLDQAVAKFEEKFGLYTLLVGILYRVRADVGKANSATDVARLLAEDAAARSMQSTITTILAQRENTPTSNEWISNYQLWLSHLQSAGNERVSYGYQQHITASLLTEQQRETLTVKLAELKRRYPHAQTVNDDKAIERWNAGKIELLLIHPKSAGHGLNLQHGGCKMVFVSLPWSLELYEQTVGRLHRSGQTHDVWVYLLLTNKTIDERIWGALKDKRAISDIALEELK